MRNVLRTILVLIVLGIAGLLAFVYSGVYDIAAVHPHHPVTLWLVQTMVERSVEKQAETVAVPAGFPPAAVEAEGFRHYDEMCVICHGAPGRKPAELAEGLYPEPPELAKEVEFKEGTEAAELFWVVKNGLKMSGMPAFGPTHSDEELWAVVALVQQLPKMSAGEYRALAERFRPPADEAGGMEAGDHEHGLGQPAEGHEHEEGGHRH